MTSTSPTITHVVVKCHGGDLVPLPIEHAKQSKLIADMLKVLQVEENNVEIPCDALKKDVLELLTQWMQAHKDIPVETSATKSDPFPVETLTEFERNWFRDLSEDQLFDVITAANYLDMTLLLDKACETVAAMVRGRCPEEIRQIYGLTNDFTPEEYQQIMQENSWLCD